MKQSQAAATRLLVAAGPPVPFGRLSVSASRPVAEASLLPAERRADAGSGGRASPATGFFLFELKCNANQLQAVNYGCGSSRVPGTEHLKLGLLVRESGDKNGRALGALGGQAFVAGQMAARLSGIGALGHVSVEVASTEQNKPDDRKALQAALEFAAQQGHALLFAAVSRLARDASHIFEAVKRVTAAGGRVFVAVAAASLAAGPAGELLQRLVATAVAGRVGTGQTAAAWRLGDRVRAGAASNPPRLQAARELLAASLPAGVLVVCAARCSPTPDEDDNESSLDRQLECASLVAGELRQTPMRLFGRDEGRSTTDTFGDLPLRRKMNEVVEAELLKRDSAPMIVVLAWGFERLGRSSEQLRELAAYGAGLAIPVHLACCVPPRSLLDGLSPRRQIEVSLADAPCQPEPEMCDKLEALLAQPPSAGAPDLANLLLLFVGTKTLRLPKVEEYMAMAEAVKRQRADHAHLPSVAAVDYPECGSLVLKRNELPAAKVDWLLASFGGCVRMGGQPVAAPGAPQASFGQVQVAVELLNSGGRVAGVKSTVGARVGKGIGKGIGKGTSKGTCLEKKKARREARKGQRVACPGCKFDSAFDHAGKRFTKHFEVSPLCVKAVQALVAKGDRAWAGVRSQRWAGLPPAAH